jgi:hypothetical protein
MNSHELARRLLELKDLPVSTHANNHTYDSNKSFEWQEDLKIVEETQEEAKEDNAHGPRIVIGNYSKD